MSDKFITLVKENIEYLSTYEEEFYYSFYCGTNIYLSTDGYEALKNAGFEIIKNNSLTKAIVHLFSVQYQQDAEFISYIKEHFKIHESFLLQNFIAVEKRLVPIYSCF